MIKKLMIITIMILLSIVIVNQSVSAESVFIDEPAGNDGGLWHVEDGNRVYVNMRYTHGELYYKTGDVSNETYPDYDLSLYTLWYGVNQDLSFPNTTDTKSATISNPNPEIYDKFVVEIYAHMTDNEINLKEIATYDSVVNNIEIKLDDYDDKEIITWPSDWSYITLSVDGDEILSSRELYDHEIARYDLPIEPNPNAYDIYFGVRMYWEKSDTAPTIDPSVPLEIEPGVFVSPWEALPETLGSPVNPTGEWGNVSDIIVNNQEISFNVNYLGTVYPVTSFTVDGDLDFINESNDVLYYSDPNTGDKMLYFNFGETLDSAILAAKTFATVNEWKGEALWNLTQNEIKVTDVLTVYNYIPDPDSSGNVYSYFYMPDVPIDNLISVSSVLAYRYFDEEYFGIFGDLVPGEIQYKTVAAVRGETTSVIDTSWVEITYRTAYISAALVGVATYAGIIPVYGWGIAGAAFLVAGGMAIQSGAIDEWFAYDVEQIQHIYPSVALTMEINSYISEFNELDQFTSNTDKLYKLHLATLDEYDDIEIMDDLSNVTQVVWETDGEIFVVNQEYIVDYWFGPGTEIPVNSIGDDGFEVLLWVGVGIVGLYVSSKLKLDKKPGLVILIIGAAIYYLYKLGLLP